MEKLDKFDLRLLGELEKNARQTFSQIAKKLNTSQQVISYRVQSLQKRGVIGGFFTIINFALLGYTSYRTMLRFTNINTKKKEEIIAYLSKHPNVLWLVECGGRWDLIINFMAKNPIHYNNIIKDLKMRFPAQIQNYDILATIEAIYFGRDYFDKKRSTAKQLPYFGRDLKTINLDKTDLKILGFISENARLNSVEISQKIRISPNTVILRIKNMEKIGIIQGFKPLVHLEHTHYSSYKALIKLQNYREQKKQDILNYLKANVNVIGVLTFIGQWDFEMEFEVDSQQKMLDLTREFRDKFKEIIKEFEIIPLFHEHRYNHFPRDLLKSI